MFYFPLTKALIKLWGQNFGSHIGTVGARLNEPADAIARVQASMQQMVTDIANVEQARLDLQRLIAIMNESVKTHGTEARSYVRRLKTNPLFTESDGALLQVISTQPATNLTDYKPVIKVRQTGGAIHVMFRKFGADGMNIYGRLQGDGAFKLLANAKHTPYIHIGPLAVPGVEETWEFYGVPTLANIEVGQRSDIVSFKFTG